MLPVLIQQSATAELVWQESFEYQAQQSLAEAGSDWYLDPELTEVADSIVTPVGSLDSAAFRSRGLVPTGHALLSPDPAAPIVAFKSIGESFSCAKVS